ncbi:MAG: RIP metalloprotease RseP [Bacilli bacterium]
MNFIFTLLILLFILGFIVLIHELGHFLMAKRCGVYVEEFSLGMGPKLFSYKNKKKENASTITLRAFPIGGYVAMANSENDGFKIKKNQVLENKSFINKLLVLLMGIIFNFILAIVLLFLNGLIYGSPDNSPYVGDILDKSAVDVAGFEKGDLIKSVNNKKVSSWDDVLLKINIIKGKNSYSFDVLKTSGKTETYNVVPTITKDKDGKETKTFGFSISSKKEYGFVNAIKYSFKSVGNITKSLFVIIGNLFTGGISVSNLSGPVGVFSVVDQLKAQGLEAIIYLLAYLSLNVGIINLIPIPVFDGGRILITAIEEVRHKKLSDKFSSILNMIGFGILIILMVFVTLSDVLKLLF